MDDHFVEVLDENRKRIGRVLRFLLRLSDSIRSMIRRRIITFTSSTSTTSSRRSFPFKSNGIRSKSFLARASTIPTSRQCQTVPLRCAFSRIKEVSMPSTAIEALVNDDLGMFLDAFDKVSINVIGGPLRIAADLTTSRRKARRSSLPLRSTLRTSPVRPPITRSYQNRLRRSFRAGKLLLLRLC